MSTRFQTCQFKGPCFQNSSSLLFLWVLRVFLDDARALYLDVNVTVMGTTELSRTQCSLEKAVNE